MAENNPHKPLIAPSADSDRDQPEGALRRRIAELSAADRNKNEFFAVLAHELRNFMSPLCNSVALLKSDEADKTLTKRALEIMERQLQNLTRLVDDLLDISRISRGMLQVRKETCDLRAILTRAVDQVCHAVEERGQELVMSLPCEAVNVEVDAARLEQVFGNILTNASKFGGEGSHICLTLECRRGEAAPSELPHQANRVAIVRIRDEGIGIAPDKLPRIFDMYMQADRKKGQAHGGLGIGLSLARQLLSLQGGTVAASSKGLGKGSEFQVCLPLPYEHVTKSKPPDCSPQQNAEPCSQRRILLVDDNVDLADTLAMLLRDAGHNVDVVYGGLEALEAAAARIPEVVLLDIELPGISGYEVARKMRALPAMNRVLLIALTGHGRSEDRTHAEYSGFDAFLFKPITLKALEETFAQGRSG